MRGSPNVGDACPYPRDLIGDLSVRPLVDRDDGSRLAGRIIHYDGHRVELSEMERRCHVSAANDSGEAVYPH